MAKIDYHLTELQKVRSTSDVKIYNILQKSDGSIPEYNIKKDVSRFTNDLYGKGTAQDIVIRGYQYTANGKTQQVSMSQLFMTICMNRANDLELQTIDIMGEMSKSTTALSELADLEDIILNDTKKPISYTVDCSFDFLEYYANYITFLGTEVGLTPPSCIPTNEEVKKTITPAEFETYKSFLSSIIEENRKRLQGGGNMGTNFTLGLDSYRGGAGLATLSEAMISLFGASAEEFETCKWFKESKTMTNWLTTTQGYKVGDKTFTTDEKNTKLKDYISETYGIDITKSQDEVIAAIESKMDEYNTLSQDQMIDLQSLVEKRNQAYTLVSNTLRSMYNANSSTANNLK